MSNKIKSVFEWVLIGIAIFIVIFTTISVAFVDQNDRSLFGLRAYICMSDSMKATDFASGDLVIVAKVDPAKLEQGDIIAYVSQDPSSAGKTITHKIRNIKKAGAESVFVTYGTTTGRNDESPVTYDQVAGKYLFYIPAVGNFLMFLRTVPGYLLFVFQPLAILLAVRVFRSVKLQKEYNKAKLLEEIEEDRRKGGQGSEGKEKSID